MKLSVKITLFLFLITAFFIAIFAVYFSREIHRNFTSQADRLLKQAVALTQQRIDFLKTRLQSEMNSLAESLFVENENTLAAMLSSPPSYNAEVIRFAEKLRLRTTLDFLYVISESGILLSNSQEPAAFGREENPRELPLNQVFFSSQNEAVMELKKPVTFGKHKLFLRGGFFLKNQFGRQSPINLLQPEGLTFVYSEQNERSWEHDPVILTEAIPFKDLTGKPVALVTVSASLRELIQQREQILKNSLYLLAASLVLCLLIGWLISLSISRPLTRLTSAAQEMAGGNFDVHVPESGNTEIGKLIIAFNLMIEQLEESRRKLIQTERIAAWQEIAKHLAHEIKNPLTPIRTSIANLRLAMERAPDQFPEIFREASQSIIEEVEALRRLADEFAGFARFPGPQKGLHQLNDVIQRTVGLYSNSLPENVQLEWTPGEIPPFFFDAGQITQVTQNLLQNSIDALSNGGKIQVKTFPTEHNGKFWICLSVTDNGPGMTEQMKKQAFTPYFTTKAKGTGLGLAIVQRIITEHGGNILIESEPVHGTTFEVRLPMEE